MPSSFTTNKSLEQPANGAYVDTWNVPVNADMGIIDKAFGGVTALNATSGSSTLTLTQYQALILSITGAISSNITYTIPSGVGGQWIVRNTTTDASGGPWTVTILSGGGGASAVVSRSSSTIVYSDGTNIYLADSRPVGAAGSNNQVQYNSSGFLAGSANFTFDGSNVGIGTSSPNVSLQVNGGIYNSSASLVTTTTTLSGSCLGSLIEIGGSTNFTVTLPNPTLYKGGCFQIWLNTIFTITLSTPYGFFYGPTGSSASTIAISQGTTGYWYFFSSDGFNWAMTGVPHIDSSGNETVSGTLGVTGATTLAAATATSMSVAGTPVIAVAPGTSGNVLTSTGSAWSSAAPTGGLINVQNFTSSGTWTKPSLGANSRVLIQCWGGGASGGKYTNGAGGGGGGAYNERWITLSQMGATETITIGAGGAAVSSNGASGNSGGNTSVGSWVTAYGAGGGGADGTGGGGGGQISAGTVGYNESGNPGLPWFIYAYSGGCIGQTIYAGGGGSTYSNSLGASAFNHGGGGGGYFNMGGASVWGGGGGGGGYGSGYAGGTSSFAGHGGAGSSGGSGSAGTSPSGGGGGTATGGSSGAGASGQVIITVFPG